MDDRTTDPRPAGDLDVALSARLAALTASRNADRPDSTTAQPRPRRRHPAAKSRAAALALSLAATGGLTYAFARADAGTSTLVLPAQIVSDQQVTASAVSPGSSDPVIVNGAVYDNKWGPVQVQAVFAPDGSLTDVVVLQSPDDHRKSVTINERAIPLLNSEALAAQDASVDTVSGATYTSNDYRRSLQSAIDAARATQVTQLA